jgi:hypothetical protein
MMEIKFLRCTDNMTRGGGLGVRKKLQVPGHVQLQDEKIGIYRVP